MNFVPNNAMIAVFIVVLNIGAMTKILNVEVKFFTAEYKLARRTGMQYSFEKLSNDL